MFSLSTCWYFLLNLFILLLGIQLKQVDAGGDQIIVGVSAVDDVYCLSKDANNIGPTGNVPWVQLAGSWSTTAVARTAVGEWTPQGLSSSEG